MTEALIARGIDESRIVMIEYSADFCHLLRRRFPRAQVVQGDAYHVKKTLDLPHGSVASVISSLPLFTRPLEARRGLMHDCIDLLVRGAPFIQFSYALVPPVPAEPGRFTTRPSPWILRNVPPAGSGPIAAPERGDYGIASRGMIAPRCCTTSAASRCPARAAASGAARSGARRGSRRRSCPPPPWCRPPAQPARPALPPACPRRRRRSRAFRASARSLGRHGRRCGRTSPPHRGPVELALVTETREGDVGAREHRVIGRPRLAGVGPKPRPPIGIEGDPPAPGAHPIGEGEEARASRPHPRSRG